MSWFARLIGVPRGRESLPPQIFFTNTLTLNKELFVPLRAGAATLYSCGPTVYNRAHIGNLRSYVFADMIARILIEAGYHLRRVINITDVGHLTGDGDEGEDKVSAAARRTGASPKEIAERYTRSFLEDLTELNVDTGHILFPRATEYIKEQIALATTLEEKGFAYRIKSGLYFDTRKFSNYGRLGNRGDAALTGSTRVEQNPEKHHPADFALWRKAKKNDLQQWDSPWGRGNPGWHLECSAMARALLGIEIDIHTGGEDHIPVHHNNEIAQSEAASGRPFVHYWVHNAFLTVEGEKISKSLKNDIYLPDIVAKGFHPLVLRYFFLQAHYSTQLSFSWTALAASGEALGRLWRHASDLADESERKAAPSSARGRFLALVRDDLATPQALGTLWESLRSEDLAPDEKWGLLEDADRLLGLSLTEPPEEARPLTDQELPADIKEMSARRETARAAQDFTTADDLRRKIESRGYRVEDSLEGPMLTKRVR